MIWYLAFVPLIIFAIDLAVLARRWDHEAPSDPEPPVGRSMTLVP
jgi:hypothetical protein